MNALDIKATMRFYNLTKAKALALKKRTRKEAIEAFAAALGWRVETELLRECWELLSEYTVSPSDEFTGCCLCCRRNVYLEGHAQDCRVQAMIRALNDLLVR